MRQRYALKFANFIGAESMNTFGVQDQEKVRKDKAKKAIALAVQGRWEEAVAVNRAILNDFSQDLEAYNRLGKSLSELGRNRQAQEAFQQALAISPNNPIARKNLDRLMRLGDEASSPVARSSAAPRVFIEESGKAEVTSLVNLAPPEVLLKLAPGHQVQFQAGASGIKVVEPSGGYAGTVEPRLGARLTRLINGGNKYEATVTSMGDRELTIIIREVYKDPSQSGIVSFPSRGGTDHRVYLPSTLLGAELDEGETEAAEPTVVKDWSNDDTEPGDDEAFSPVLHRIISAGDEGVSEEDEDL